MLVGYCLFCYDADLKRIDRQLLYTVSILIHGYNFGMKNTYKKN
jgi:hypothetical protein